MNAFSILREECLDYGWSIFEEIPTTIEKLKIAWDLLDPTLKKDFELRAAAEEHLIKTLKDQSKQVSYEPINYYDRFLKH